MLILLHFNMKNKKCVVRVQSSVALTYIVFKRALQHFNFLYSPTQFCQGYKLFPFFCVKSDYNGLTIEHIVAKQFFFCEMRIKRNLMPFGVRKGRQTFCF